MSLQEATPGNVRGSDREAGAQQEKQDSVIRLSAACPQAVSLQLLGLKQADSGHHEALL